LLGTQFSRIEDLLPGFLLVARLNGSDMFPTRAMTALTGYSGNEQVDCQP
jgi:hypothetical protein